MSAAYLVVNIQRAKIFFVFCCLKCGTTKYRLIDVEVFVVGDWPVVPSVPNVRKQILALLCYPEINRYDWMVRTIFKQ